MGVRGCYNGRLARAFARPGGGRGAEHSDLAGGSGRTTLHRKGNRALRQSYKTALLWVFLIVMFIALWKLFE